MTVPAPNGERVVAVVVTWNRRELLARALSAVLGQTRPPDAVVAVDNASTDGTDALLREFSSQVRPVRLAENTGGAGGFAVGIGAALDGGADLIWLMDDDTVPEPGALAALLAARRRHADPVPTLVASRVVWTDGRDHPMNTPRPNPFARRRDREAARRSGCVPVRSASFVSVLVDARACLERGLPVADYFLWNDDFEFTTRLLRGRVGLLCPDSVVVHHTRTFGSTDVDPGDRFFYEVRNKVWLLTRSRGLGPVERAVYAGSTLRRWVRTIASSADRATLVRAMGRGVRAGLLRGPRTNEDVLAGARSAAQAAPAAPPPDRVTDRGAG